MYIVSIIQNVLTLGQHISLPSLLLLHTTADLASVQVKHQDKLNLAVLQITGVQSQYMRAHWLSHCTPKQLWPFHSKTGFNLRTNKDQLTRYFTKIKQSLFIQLLCIHPHWYCVSCQCLLKKLFAYTAELMAFVIEIHWKHQHSFKEWLCTRIHLPVLYLCTDGSNTWGIIWNWLLA